MIRKEYLINKNIKRYWYLKRKVASVCNVFYKRLLAVNLSGFSYNDLVVLGRW